MITAKMLKKFSSMTCEDLKEVLASSGYSDVDFEFAIFVGINENGNFCYSAGFQNENSGESDRTMVYVIYDHHTDSLSADF